MAYFTDLVSMESSSIMEAVSLSDDEPEPESNEVTLPENPQERKENVETLQVPSDNPENDSNPVILKKSELNDPFNSDDIDIANEEIINSPQKSSKLNELQLRIEALETERGQLTAEILSKDNAITKLEAENSSYKSEISDLETSHSSAIAEHERKFSQFSEETALKIGELKKQFFNANKEKESMVMKYALNEREIIIQKKHRDEADKKCKNALKERDEAVNKAKNAIADKLKLQQLCDSRLQDNQVLKREIDKWKEEAKVQETQKNLQVSKLKLEVENHENTREKLDKLTSHLSETRIEIDKTRNEYNEFIQKLKEEKQEQSVKLMIDEAAQSELETLKINFAKMSEDNEKLTATEKELKNTISELESNVDKLKNNCEEQKVRIDEMMSQAAELEQLKLKLSNEESKLSKLQGDMEKLTSENAELCDNMDEKAKKESELLDFTQKLTEKNVELNSNLTFIESRANILETEHSRLTGQVSELQAMNGQLKIELESETKNRKCETETLAKKLAESMKTVESFRQKVTDANNEVSVLKRKNASSLRELTKELKECQRKLESSHHLRVASPLSASSRASSNSSLHKLANNEESNSSSSNLSLASSETIGNGYVRTNPQIQVTILKIRNIVKNVIILVYFIQVNSLPSNVPDSQVLVEKIVKLQKELAKRQEKLDFMEEHVSTMVEEMKKKNKLLQNLMLKQDVGSLATSDMDDNKVIWKHQVIMLFICNFCIFLSMHSYGIMLQMR